MRYLFSFPNPVNEKAARVVAGGVLVAVLVHDPRISYETSSYGPAAIEMMARRVGEAQLLYGSDRPVTEPKTTGRDARLQTNGASLFRRVAVAA